jgi:molybdopterin-guanine dinucleotide biosynthesis protein A
MPEKERMRLGAIILAGGASSRMGRPKESLPWNGDTLLGHTCRTLAGCCAPVVVVARDRAQTLPPLPAGTTIVCDAPGAAGPLAGLLAGLRALRAAGFTDDDAAFATACDHPFLHAGAVRGLSAELGDGLLVMPRPDAHLQPLCAIYRLRCQACMQRLLDAGERSPSALAMEPGARIVPGAALRRIDAELDFLRSANTPAEFAALQRLARRAP